MSFGFTPFAAAPFASPGTVGDRAVVNVTGVSLTATVSNSYTVQKTHFVSGLNLTSNVGTVLIKTQPIAGSNAVSSNVGTVGISAGQTLTLTGNALNVTLGAVVPELNVNVTGNAVTSNVGTATATGTAVAAVTGTSSTLSAGTVSPAADANISVTGTSSTVTLGSVEELLAPTIASNSVTSSVGTVSLSTGHIIAVTGTSSTLSAGTAVAKLAPTITSNSLTSSVGAPEQTFFVGVANPGSGNVFYINGTPNPALALIRGQKYIFDQSNNTNSGHPLRFKDGDGNSYTDGVVVTGSPGQAGAKVEITVPSDAPSSLRYYCTVHGNGMGNVITVSNLITIIGSANVVAQGTTVNTSLGTVTGLIGKEVAGQSLNTSVNSVSITLSPTAAVTGELLPLTVNPLSVFTWSAVDDTTTGGATWSDVSTTGAGGSSYSEVDSTTGAGGSSWQEVA